MRGALEESANPSSIYQAGQRAKLSLERARKHVAALIGAAPRELFFTSSGTESNNWALRGLLAGQKRKGLPAAPGASAGRAAQAGNHLIISAIEHPSVSLVARRLEADHGVHVSILPVDHEGRVSPAELQRALRPETVLVSLMLANGEVGTLQPIAELAAVAREHGALFHTDAIAAAGHVAIDVKALGVDALSLAASQFYGPQGAAALFVREGVRILPLLEGGGQEQGGRSGTEAIAAVIGMGVAAEAASRDLPGRTARLAALRDRLREGLSRIDGVRFNGSWTARLPHNIHACADGVTSESLVLGLDQAGISAGLGSACNSKAMRPSHVLKAMGLTDEQARGALVLTVGVPTTDEEVAQAIERMPQVIDRLRKVTALTSRA